MTGRSQVVRELVARYFAAVDDERIDDIVDCFNADAAIRFSFHHEPVRGHAALREFFAAHVARFAEHRDVVTRVVADGDLAISEIVFDATTADGRPVHLETCNVYRFRGGRFQDVRVYLDTVEMARQLGST